MKPSAYCCDKCDRGFCFLFDLIEHDNVHSGASPFLCTSCKRSFSLIRDYVDHVKKERSCAFDFKPVPEKSSRSTISSTVDKKIGEKSNEKFSGGVNKLNCVGTNNKNLSTPSFCAICQIQFNSVKKLKLHKKELHSLTCANCKKLFSDPKKFNSHTCLDPNSSQGFKCSCMKVFSTTDAFKLHVGSKPFPCCSCPMKFNSVTNLITHIRTHTKQKPYICLQCGRGFSQSANLRNHSSIHLGINVVKCSECDFSCKTLNGLIKHKKKHGQGLVNNFDGRKKSLVPSKCPICNKEFSFKRNMKMHMKSHTTSTLLCTDCGKVFNLRGKLTSHYKACHRQPSVCKTCGKKFASAVLLTAHEKIHVSNKLYSCSVCHKLFSVKNYLVQHMKTHTNKKQFSCSKCGKLFKVSVSLKYHSNICASIALQV